jgi:hypothetical protein
VVQQHDANWQSVHVAASHYNHERPALQPIMPQQLIATGAAVPWQGATVAHPTSSGVRINKYCPVYMTNAASELKPETCPSQYCSQGGMLLDYHSPTITTLLPGLYLMEVVSTV